MKIQIKQFTKKEDKKKKKKLDDASKFLLLSGASHLVRRGGFTICDSIQEHSKPDKELIEKLKEKAIKDGAKLSNSENASYNFTEDTININGNPNYNIAAALAHEMGHRHFFKDKDANKIGKLAHDIKEKNPINKKMVKSLKKIKEEFEGIKEPTKEDERRTKRKVKNLMRLTKLRDSIPIISTLGLGVATGIRKANLEDKNKEEGIVNKHLATIAPVLQKTPELVREAAASIYGHKLLKQSGATKKDLLKADIANTGAFGTYLGNTILLSAAGKGSKEIAYHLRKKSLKKKKEKEKEDN